MSDFSECVIVIAFGVTCGSLAVRNLFRNIVGIFGLVNVNLLKTAAWRMSLACVESHKALLWFSAMIFRSFAHIPLVICLCNFMKLSNIDKKWKREIFKSENLVPPTRNDGNPEPYQGCMGDIPQIQTRVDIEKLHAQTPSTAFRRHSFSDCLLRSGNMGTQRRTRKNDSIDATQDATTHHPNKRKYKKIEKQDIGTNEEIEEIDINGNV